MLLRSSRHLSTRCRTSITCTLRNTHSHTQAHTQQPHIPSPAPPSIAMPYDTHVLGNPATSTHTAHMLMFHALLASRSQWQPFLRHLHRTCTSHQLTIHAYTADMRNHGEAEHTQTHTLYDLAADIGSMCQHMQQRTSAPLMLCGHSQGEHTGAACTMAHAAYRDDVSRASHVMSPYPMLQVPRHQCSPLFSPIHTLPSSPLHSPSHTSSLSMPPPQPTHTHTVTYLMPCLHSIYITRTVRTTRKTQETDRRATTNQHIE